MTLLRTAHKSINKSKQMCYMLRVCGFVKVVQLLFYMVREKLGRSLGMKL